MTGVTGMERVAAARSFLFVPATQPDRFPKAERSGTDLVVLDLEDAVAADMKEQARAHVEDWVTAGHRCLVRINAAGSRWFDADVELISRCGLDAVLLPKTEDPGDVARLRRQSRADLAVVPILETASGILDAQPICNSAGVVRAGFGNGDLGADIGVDPDDRAALALARAQVVLASAAGGIASPIDGVTLSFRDDDRLTLDARHAKSLGYGAKFCVHPRQVDLVNRAFTASAAEIEWARTVIGSAGGEAAIDVGGQLIDKPILDRAHRILAAADRPPGMREPLT